MLKSWLKSFGLFAPSGAENPAVPKKDMTGLTIADCSANPYNLCPAVEAIMARIDRVSASLNGKPLVLLMGENHSTPAHIILQLLILKTLKEKYGRDKIACGFERPHNDLGRSVGIMNAYMTAAISAADHDGQRGLASALTRMYAKPEAPVSSATLYNFCRSEKLTTRFTDAAGVSVLSVIDPYTKKLISRHTPLKSPIIPRGSPFGMKLRNIAMLEGTQSLIESAAPLIFIHHGGMAHIFGEEIKGAMEEMSLPYEESLSSLFVKANIAVLPVFITGKETHLENIPAGACRALESGVVLTGVTDEQYYASGDGSEKEFIAKMARESATEINIFDPGHAVLSQEASVLAQQVKEEMPGWLNEARAALTP